MTEQQHETNEVHQAAGAWVRDLVLLGTQTAEVLAMRRMHRSEAAKAASDQEREQIIRRLLAEQAAADPVMRQARDEKWWRSADHEAIKRAWDLTAGWAAAGNADAARTLEYMRQRIELETAASAKSAAPRPRRGTGAEQLAALLASQAGRWDAVKLLRQHAGRDWWTSADPADIAGVWDAVRDWPEGTQRNAARAHLRQGMQKAYGITPHPGLKGSTVAGMAAKARGLDSEPSGAGATLVRARGEEAAARRSADTAEGLAATGSARSRIGGEAEHAEAMRGAAADDYGLAGRVAGADDPQVREVIRRAGLGRLDTPASQRRAAASQRRHGPARRHPPRARQQEHPQLPFGFDNR